MLSKRFKIVLSIVLVLSLVLVLAVLASKRSFDIGRLLNTNIEVLMTSDNLKSDPGTIPIPFEACVIVIEDSGFGYYEYQEGASYLTAKREILDGQDAVAFQRDTAVGDSEGFITLWEGESYLHGRLWECTNIEMAIAMESFAAAYYRVQHPEILVWPLFP